MSSINSPSVDRDRQRGDPQFLEEFGAALVRAWALDSVLPPPSNRLYRGQ